jgi:hypothetical protein
LKEATELQSGDDFLEWKQFFQKIGSNPEIKDKTVHIHWGELWEFVAFAKANRDTDCVRIASRYAHHIPDFASVSLGDPTGSRTPLLTLKT